MLSNDESLLSHDDSLVTDLIELDMQKFFWSFSYTSRMEQVKEGKAKKKDNQLNNTVPKKQINQTTVVLSCGGIEMEAEKAIHSGELMYCFLWYIKVIATQPGCGEPALSRGN